MNLIVGLRNWLSINRINYFFYKHTYHSTKMPFVTFTMSCNYLYFLKWVKFISVFRRKRIGSVCFSKIFITNSSRMIRNNRLTTSTTFDNTTQIVNSDEHALIEHSVAKYLYRCQMTFSRAASLNLPRLCSGRQLRSLKITKVNKFIR